MENRTLVSVRNLRMWYSLRKGVFGRAGHVRAVDDVSFDLAEGEAITIVGESGCGKSSLARTILGLHRPSGGEIIFDGKAIHKADAQLLHWYHRQVGFVQQDPYGALPPFMTVRAALAEPLIIHGIPRSEHEGRIRTALQEVKLVPFEQFEGKFPHMLSGGQQQRVVIARAILLRPKLIVADEPVSMLDASVRVEILEIFRSLQMNHKLSVVFITHDLSTVRHFCERAFVMYAGQVIEKGHVDALLDNPLHPYTRALLHAIPAGYASASALPHAPRRPASRPARRRRSAWAHAAWRGR